VCPVSAANALGMLAIMSAANVLGMPATVVFVVLPAQAGIHRWFSLFG